MKNTFRALFLTSFIATSPAAYAFFETGESSEPVKVNTAEAFKGVEDVVIGGFTVGFDIYKTDSVKAGGGLMGSGFGGKSTARSSLVGVDEKTMQNITDKAYQDFVSRLKEAGYNVVERSKLTETEDFKGTKVYPNPYEYTSGGMLGGGNTTKFFAPSSFGGVSLFMGDLPGEGGIGFSSPVAPAAVLAEQSGIKVLHVKYEVDFANSEKYGGWHTRSSSINVEQGISVPGGSAHIGIIGGQGGTFSTNIGSIGLAQTISTDQEFAEISDATSDTDRTVQVVTNVVGVLGGIGSNSSSEYEFKADQSAYQVATYSTLKNANDILVTEMKNLK